MGVTTIKRNGVFIIFPTRESAPIKEKTPASTIHPALPPHIKQKVKGSQSELHMHSVIRKKTQAKGNRCWHCGEPVWRSDVNYCWDCYKYEYFESK